MWLQDVLRDVSGSATREYWQGFVTPQKDEHMFVGTVPEDVRPLLVRRFLFDSEMRALMFAPANEETSKKLAWLVEQNQVIGSLIHTSLKHVGITLDPTSHYVLGHGWQILKERGSIIILATDKRGVGLTAGQLNIGLSASVVRGDRPRQSSRP